MKCEGCNGKKKQRTRQYKIFNTILKKCVRKLVLCDSCAFPLFFAQVKHDEDVKG